MCQVVACCNNAGFRKLCDDDRNMLSGKFGNSLLTGDTVSEIVKLVGWDRLTHYSISCTSSKECPNFATY